MYDNMLAPSTTLGKAMDVVSCFGPMAATYEQVLKYLEERTASADRLKASGVYSVW